MPTPDAKWTAVEISGHEMTVWQMEATSAINKATHDYSPSIALEECLTHASIASEAPVLVSGLALCQPAKAPTKPGDQSPTPLAAGTYDVRAIPGVFQQGPSAVMQGNETRISGFLALNPSWDGVICLPGSPSHWALVSAGELVSFQGFLSVDLFEALCTEPVLGWDRGVLTKTAEDTMSKPALLAARLAEARADQDLNVNSVNDRVFGSRLFGALLGAELAASRPYWLGQNLALIGAQPYSEAYAAVLEAQGLPVTIADPTAMALAGLTAAWRRLNHS